MCLGKWGWPPAQNRALEGLIEGPLPRWGGGASTELHTPLLSTQLQFGPFCAIRVGSRGLSGLSRRGGPRVPGNRFRQ